MTCVSSEVVRVALPKLTVLKRKVANQCLHFKKMSLIDHL